MKRTVLTSLITLSLWVNAQAGGLDELKVLNLPGFDGTGAVATWGKELGDPALRGIAVQQLGNGSDVLKTEQFSCLAGGPLAETQFGLCNTSGFILGILVETTDGRRSISIEPWILTPVDAPQTGEIVVHVATGDAVKVYQVERGRNYTIEGKDGVWVIGDLAPSP